MPTSFSIRGLFSGHSCDVVIHDSRIEIILRLVRSIGGTSVSAELNYQLTNGYLVEELKEALFQGHSDDLTPFFEDYVFTIAV